MQMIRTCVFVIEARFLKASEEKFNRSIVNVFRHDLNVTLLVTSAAVAEVTAVQYNVTRLFVAASGGKHD